MAKATFAAGCFWGVEAEFRRLKGVTSTQVGYTGGHTKNPNYKQVCTDGTGHAEAVEVDFDPTKVSYRELLAVFFQSHDPTQLNRQGPDTGTQYRSAIFTENGEQAMIAKAYIVQLNQAGVFNATIATRVTQLQDFYAAENYHQNFLVVHPNHPYIVINDIPKIENLRRVYPDIYRADPVLVATAGVSN
jgi:peptide-methionine (S)-S-oxide reductase